jgi:hypothetical protein
MLPLDCTLTQTRILTLTITLTLALILTLTPSFMVVKDAYCKLGKVIMAIKLEGERQQQKKEQEQANR